MSDVIERDGEWTRLFIEAILAACPGLSRAAARIAAFNVQHVIEDRLYADHQRAVADATELARLASLGDEHLTESDRESLVELSAKYPDHTRGSRHD
jgi:hypothetical protein